MGTISERFDTRNNSLNFIRLSLASMVIVSHAAPIGGFSPAFQFGGVSAGTLAVGGFFAISGYLITRSGFTSPLPAYLWRRFLRIFPGYWACLIAVGFGFASVASIVRGGWSVGSGAEYVLGNMTMVLSSNNELGALTGAAFPETWNGSLWTLRYELLCYIAVGVALLSPAVRRVRFVFPLSFGVLTVASVIVQFSGGPLIVRDVALLVPFFLAGATLFRYAHRVPLDGRFAAGAAAFLVIVLILGLGKSLAAMPVAYLCIWLGTVLNTPFKQVGKRNDISYGMYLYGFPVQQILVLAEAHKLGLLVFTVLGVLATVPLAAASWFLVERPAMSFKNLRPGRLTGPWGTSPAEEANASVHEKD